MGEKRVIEQTASDEIYNDDWFLKDSVLHDTTKVQPSVIKEYVNQGMATSQDLADEATARQNSDSMLASGIAQQMANLADFYNTTKSYVVGDVCVLQSGELMRCIAPTSGAFDGTKWESVTVDELFDDLNFNADAISYDNTSSGLEAENVQDAIDEVVADVDAVETALETKAEKNGVYDDLVAGNLLSDSYTADNTPYLYRQSPSASSVEQNIVGGTVAWNQLAKELIAQNWGAINVTPSYSNGEVTITSSADGTVAKILNPLNIQTTEMNHVYYVCGYGKSDGITETNIGAWQTNGGDYTGATGTIWTASTSYTPLYKIVKKNAEGSMLIGARLRNTTPNGSSGTFKNIMFIDLTQAFGSTIADYVYSLEQATVGSGIAWLKANGFLTKDYYPYNSGSLQSVKTSGRKIVGVNQWDEEWELGSIDTETGANVVSSAIIRSKNYILVNPNTAYYHLGRLQLYFYDKDKNYISYSAFTNEGVFTTPSNAVYVRFTITSSYGTTYNHDISINYPSTDTEYHAYEEHTYPLSPIDLRGIPKLDSNNNLYYDGDIYESDGSVKRRYGIVDLGTLTWTYNTSSSLNPFFYAPINGIKSYGAPYNVAINAISSLYKVVRRTQAEFVDGCLCGDGTVTDILQIQVKDSKFTDASAFKTAMNGVYLVYELATPTSETADAYENPQLVGSTEEFIDTRDVPIPVGGERKYHTDLKAKLEELAKIPDVPSANGTYKLIATRSASGVTYSWVSD